MRKSILNLFAATLLGLWALGAQAKLEIEIVQGNASQLPIAIVQIAKKKKKSVRIGRKSGRKTK